MMSDALYIERLVLRHNEGPPGKRIARRWEPFYDHLRVWGYGAREILTCAQQPIQTEEDGGLEDFLQRGLGRLRDCRRHLARDREDRDAPLLYLSLGPSLVGTV